MPMEPLISVVQLGARMHYAVPRIFAEAGRLERFFTDICAVRGWPKLLGFIPGAARPPAVRRLIARVPQGVPPRLITAFNRFGREYASRRARASTSTETTAAHLWAGREFGRRVIARGLGRATTVYCFNSAGLEIMQRAKAEGRRTVLEQTIAPRRIELELLAAEREACPDWESADQDNLADEFIAREEAEWRAADVILCGSEFVREGIARGHGPVEKCVVVPYGVDIPSPHRGEGGRRPDEVASINLQLSTLNRPLRVLTVGAVGLRKGSPYVLETTRRLKGRAQFRMVGTIAVTLQTQARLREHLELLGRVPRNEVRRHFEWADVFLLPSVCEGSATVTYEALAHGLPVICTPNTGSVVRDGLEGFVVPAGDSDAIADRLEALCANRAQLVEMSHRATARAEEFTLEKYGQRLLAVVG
jgi:hypothetical protein